MWLGLAKKRTLLLPTWKGVVVVIVLLMAIIWLVLANVYDVLAIDNRLPTADIVIVEGWSNDTGIKAAIEELNAGRCHSICTIGVALGRGAPLIDYKDFASLAAASLRQAGVASEKIIIAPGGGQLRDRTYVSYVKGKEKLVAQEPPVTRVNIISEGPHARRSYIVAHKVFGEDYEIGMLIVDPVDYDHNRWYASSGGVKAVFMEAMACAFEWVGDGGRK